jgi:hypothetical protein
MNLIGLFHLYLVAPGGSRLLMPLRATGSFCFLPNSGMCEAGKDDIRISLVVDSVDYDYSAFQTIAHPECRQQ